MTKVVSLLREHVDSNPLRKWRIAHGTTFTELSALLGVTTYTIQKWEQGASVPDSRHRQKLASLLETSEAELSKEWEQWKNQIPQL